MEKLFHLWPTAFCRGSVLSQTRTLLFPLVDIILLVDTILGNTHNVISVFFISRLLILHVRSWFATAAICFSHFWDSEDPDSDLQWVPCPATRGSLWHWELRAAYAETVQSCICHGPGVLLPARWFLIARAASNQSASTFSLGLWWQYFLQSFVTSTLVTDTIYPL